MKARRESRFLVVLFMAAVVLTVGATEGIACKTCVLNCYEHGCSWDCATVDQQTCIYYNLECADDTAGGYYMSSDCYVSPWYPCYA